VTENNVARKIEEAVGRYIAVWNEPDADARCHAIGELWTKDGSYTNPLAAVEGHRAIGEVIAGARDASGVEEIWRRPPRTPASRGRRWSRALGRGRCSSVCRASPRWLTRRSSWRRTEAAR
jgi:hypothetical protein